jgi:hypothetical protein
VIVTFPAVFPVAVTEQLPPVRVQLVAERVTLPAGVPGVWDHVTVPVGDWPVTVAVQVDCAPMATCDGEQVTDVPEVPVIVTVTYALLTPSEVTYTP